MSPQQLLSTIIRQTTAFPEHGWFTLVSFPSLFFASCSLSERLLKSETTWITKCSIFAGVIQNQQTVALSEVCAGVCEPTIDENKCSAVSPHSVFRKGRRGVRGIITRQGEKKWSMQHACLWWINAVLHELMRDVRNMLRICYTQWSI